MEGNVLVSVWVAKLFKMSKHWQNYAASFLVWHYDMQLQLDSVPAKRKVSSRFEFSFFFSGGEGGDWSSKPLIGIKSQIFQRRHFDAPGGEMSTP